MKIKEKERGWVLMELIFLVPIIAVGALVAFLSINSITRAQKLSEAGETVKNIAAALHGMVHEAPDTDEDYLYSLRKRGINPIDPWGKPYKAIAYSGLRLGQGLCYINEVPVSVIIKERGTIREIKNVLYFVWTELPGENHNEVPPPEGPPDGEDSSDDDWLYDDDDESGEGSGGSSGTSAPIFSTVAFGQIEPEGGVIYSMFTLDMYKALYCHRFRYPN